MDFNQKCLGILPCFMHNFKSVFINVFFELTTQQKERYANMWCRKAKKGPVRGKFKHEEKNCFREGFPKKYGNVSRRLNFM